MNHRLRPLQRALCAALPLLALQGTSAWAQTSTVFQPTVLHRFTGTTDANALGGLPEVPPLLGTDGLLHGMTRTGGGASGFVAQGTAYRVDPTGLLPYQFNLMGTLGITTSTMVLGSDGTIYAGTAASNTNAAFPFGAPAYFKLQAGVPSLLSLPTVGPRGQLAIDEQDNVYLGIDSAIITCSSNSRGPLWRMSPDGTQTKVMDFCDYAVTSGANQLHPKGGNAVASVWSKADQALYVVTAVDARGVFDATATSDNSGRSVGTLVKISKAALDAGVANNGAIDEGNVELLHTFLRNRDGQPTAKGGRLTGLVEAGQWLYGTSYANPVTAGADNSVSYSGTVWRVKKGDPSSFTVVHRFRSDQATAPDTTATADGGTPHGPLVVAADGNIYGTTYLDGSLVNVSGSVTTPVGAGTLYRIRVGQQADRSDDVYEVLHRFDFGTEGGRPSGLSLGRISNGIQKLYGANGTGGSGEAIVVATQSAPGSGTLFSFDVPVPVSFTTPLAVSAPSARVGDSITLTWAVENASTCAASGDNGSTWTGTQQVSGNQVSLNTTLSKVGVNTFTLRCENTGTGLSAEQTVSVTVAAASTASSGGGGGGGALGLGWLLAVLPLGAAQLRRRFIGTRA